MSPIKIGIRKLEDLLYDKKMRIPFYQRPYSWTEKQVAPLMADLYTRRNKEEPIIMGGIILHSNVKEEFFDIVDGQQRLLTYSVLVHLLKSKKVADVLPLLNIPQENIHQDTQKNIAANARYITDIIQRKAKEPDLENIYFIVVITYSLDDAFSFFDSQNTRGKKLEAYDILKAHHLRFIESDDLATWCVKDWNGIQKDKKVGLTLLLEILLLRARKWSRNQHYSHDLLEEFKSQRTDKKNLTEYDLCRYTQAALFSKWRFKPAIKDLEFFFNTIKTEYSQSSLKVTGDYANLPFQLGQTIEGGELFFWYTGKYYSTYNELFAEDNCNLSVPFKYFLSNLKEFNYNSGTEYTYQVYEGTLLFYFDKFGYSRFEEVAVLLFYTVYWMRMKLYSVQYASVYKFIRENETGANPFAWINEASFPEFIMNKCRDFLEGKYVKGRQGYTPTGESAFKGIRKNIFEDLLVDGKCDFLTNNTTYKI